MYPNMIGYVVAVALAAMAVTVLARGGGEETKSPATFPVGHSTSHELIDVEKRAEAPLLAAGGGLVTIIREAYPNITTCSVKIFDPSTGDATVLVDDVSTVCQDRSSANSRASSAWLPPTAVTELHKNGVLDSQPSAAGLLLVTTGSGKYVWGINVATGALSKVAALPAGLDVVSIGYDASTLKIFVLSTDALYLVANGDVTKVYSGISLNSITAAVAWSGTGSLYAADASGHLLTLDLVNYRLYSTALSISVLNLDWLGANNTLVALASYELYDVDPVDGSLSKLWKVPDGNGYPATHTVNDFVYYVADFQNLYTVSLFDYSILDKVAFDGYFTVGGIHYVAASTS
ncbi:uncharacterized protein AMSG_10498 [Thecamonas trahens ATCC 50062]|uniref:Uncharacterized protein n=1 Tax=Thecamonas trahens ATCC 50062 TaxID=461836 RepID=A0A0L0DQF4_THETB|nr:hypothetical protein AMSG_10498 [Thecamonas trahens ATCC 50062]KNC54500.1 hypothetical protein AMSG_10498 [Thecamonas trahens ATCC 50062]|eukprot:XP_013753653.1 hypothetical protein AMSG_10498 [Thecamonas trahens ATCC 50062]